MEVHDPRAWAGDSPEISALQARGAAAQHQPHGQHRRATLENFYIVGESWAATVSRFLGRRRDGARHRLRLRAHRALPDAAPRHRYVDSTSSSRRSTGRTSIWCRSLRIACASSTSTPIPAHYNRAAHRRRAEVRFPVADGAIDVAFAAVALHAPARARRGALPRGVGAEPAQGRRAGGEHPYGAQARRALLGREDRIDIEPGYFVSMAEHAGLRVREDLGLICGQDSDRLRAS
jgi:hypothetical protein